MAGKRYKTSYPGIFFRLVKRVGGKGDEKVFYAVWTESGRVREARIGLEFRDNMTPAKAAKIRGQFMEHERLTPQEKRDRAAANLSITEIWDKYKLSLTVYSTRKSATSNFKRIPPPVANKRPYDITTREVAAWDSEMEAEGLSPQSRRHSLSLLARLIAWGQKNGHCDAPAGLTIDLPKTDNMKTEVLTDDQLASLQRALDSDFNQLAANAVRLAMLTGIRRSALFSLEWRDVDFERGFLTLRGSSAKSGRTASIPMSAPAREVLEELRDSPARQDSPFLFPTRGGKRRTILPKDFVTRVKKAANLPEGFRFLHGLRHNFASRMASSGKISLYTLQHLLTHESPEMTQRYAHLMDEALRRAAGVVDDVFKKDN